MPLTHAALLEYYAAPGVFTGVDGFEHEIDAIPNNVPAIAAAVQGLIIHKALAPYYKVTLPEERLTEPNLHGAAAMLTCAHRLDARPVSEPRKPDRRLAGVCRHFALLFVAMARHKGIPSRVRCGFADYFETGKHVEHWVGEYWRADQHRWVLVDAQVDGPQRAFFRPDFDTLDVPRDRFLVAGDAWRACRNGAEASTFGVGGTDLWGLVEVFGEMFQDLANLQKIELLPWGWYGLAKDEAAIEREPGLLDCLADLTSAADGAAIDTLRAMVAADDRLQVPADALTAIIEADRAFGSSTHVAPT